MRNSVGEECGKSLEKDEQYAEVGGSEEVGVKEGEREGEAMRTVDAIL